MQRALLSGVADVTDLLVAAPWGVAVAAIVAGPPLAGVAVRPVVAPGYLVVTAPFPRADQLSLLERSVFRAGASLAPGGLVCVLVSRSP